VTEWNDHSTIAYCGLVCAGCSAVSNGCPGCRQGGGDDPCLVRTCCEAHGRQGCWECEQGPCDKGPFGRPDSAGLCAGLVQAVQVRSLEGMLARVRHRMGDVIDYGALSGISAAEVQALLNDE
jgi:hypothetical protein